MIELSKERIEQILHEETPKKEDSSTILRSIYTRYRRLYEQYLEDMDVLSDEKIAAFRKYSEETMALIRVYYMDIPEKTCEAIKAFEDEYSAELLGSGWKRYLLDSYEAFKEECETECHSEEDYRAQFKKQALTAFYKKMDSIFREGFDTEDKTVSNAVGGIAGLLFGRKKE